MSKPKRHLVVPLAASMLLGMVPPAQAVFKTKLPCTIDFIKKQVKAAGYDYEALVSPKKVFPKTKIRIYTFFTEVWLEPFYALANEYNKFQPNVEIQFVQGPGNYQEKLYAMISANVAPEVCMTEVSHVPYFLNSGFMEPLDRWIKADRWGRIVDDTFPTIVDRFTDDGKLYGLATAPGPQAVTYYNKTLFNQAGLPVPSEKWLLEDALMYGKKLTQPDKKQWGFYPGPELSYIYTFGGRLTDSYKKPTKFIYNSPQAKAGLEFFQSTFLKHKVCLDPTRADPFNGFNTGKLAMYINGIWDSPYHERKKGLVWDALPHPRLTADTPATVATGGTSFCIVRNTKNQDISWDIVKFLTGPIGQVVTSVQGSTQPALEAMFWTEVWAKNTDRKPDNKGFLAEACKHVVYVPDTQVWPQISAEIFGQLTKAWTGRQTIDQAISTSLPQAQRMLTEATARRARTAKK